MAVREASGEAVLRRFDADRECPKCGTPDVAFTWCPGHQRAGHYGPLDGRYVSYGRCLKGEHLHRHCQACHYEWLEACRARALDGIDDAGGATDQPPVETRDDVMEALLDAYQEARARALTAVGVPGHVDPMRLADQWVVERRCIVADCDGWRDRYRAAVQREMARLLNDRDGLRA
jgi:hypothetical protein